jgi:hypothetical protein
MSSLVPQPRPFPYRPGVPSGGETHMPNGNLVRTAPDGSITDLHSSQHNMSVHYGLSGSRQVRVEQPDGSRVVLGSRGVPYMQKPWNFGARAFDHRTYLDNGRLTHQFYRPYSYRDITLDVYAPQRFYSQDFYQWAAKPQPWAPPSWTFVTRQEPWYAHYQTYFTPHASYASPVLWLTDFVLAMSLFEAYNAHPLPTRAPPAAPAAPAAPTSQPITQASTAPAPIVQPPIARAPTPAAAAIAGGPDQAPVLQAPVTGAPTAQVLGAAPPAAQVARASGPSNPTRAHDDGPSLWQRFTNYIRTLLGWSETPHQTLQAAPAAAPVAAEPVVAQSAAPITGDVKALVADEVKRQIEEEAREARANAQSEEPKPGEGGVVEELRRPTQHVFVVASDLDLVDDSGRRCMMSEADVVQIVSAVNTKTDTAQGVVLSSKGGVECTQAATVDIAVSDLQEMQNHMRATIDQGLANTPRGAAEPTVTAAFAAAAPPPDPEAKTAIEQQKAIAASVDKG